MRTFLLLFLFLVAGCATSTPVAYQAPVPASPKEEPSQETISQAGGFYRTNQDDAHALTVNHTKVVLSGTTITKRGNRKEGSNAAVMVESGGSLTLSRGVISAKGNQAEGLAVRDRASQVTLSDTKISTDGPNSAALVCDHASVMATECGMETHKEGSPGVRIIGPGSVILCETTLVASNPQEACISLHGHASLQLVRSEVGGATLATLTEGTATIRAISSTLGGTIHVERGATLQLTLQEKSRWSGTIRGEGKIEVRLDDSSLFTPEEEEKQASILPIS